MSRRFFRVKKGMVFSFERFDSQSKYVQKIERPWVVISGDETNLAFSTCCIAPCTTQPKFDVPVHVPVIVNGKNSTVLLESVVTVDQELLTKYMGVLRDDFIQDIDKALTVYFGLDLFATSGDVQSIISRLESVVTSVVKSRIDEYNNSDASKNALEDSAIRLSEMIEDLVGPKPAVSLDLESSKKLIGFEEIKSHEEDIVVSEDSSPNKSKSTSNLYISVEVADKLPEILKKYLKVYSDGFRYNWDDTLRAMFLEDFEKLGAEKTREKYGFSSASSVHTSVYRIKKRLSNGN